MFKLVIIIISKFTMIAKNRRIFDTSSQTREERHLEGTRDPTRYILESGMPWK